MNKMLKKVDNRTDDGTAPDPSRIEIKEIQMLIEQKGFNVCEFTRTIEHYITSEKVLLGVKEILFRPPVAPLAG